MALPLYLYLQIQCFVLQINFPYVTFLFKLSPECYTDEHFISQSATDIHQSDDRIKAIRWVVFKSNYFHVAITFKAKMRLLSVYWFNEQLEFHSHNLYSQVWRFNSMKQPTSWQRVTSIECDIMTSSGNNVIIFTARKRSLRRLCFYRWLSVRGGGVGMHGGRGSCMVVAGGMHGGRGACMVAGGMHGGGGGGHAWWWGHVWWQEGCAWWQRCAWNTMRYSQWVGGTHPTRMHSCYAHWFAYWCEVILFVGPLIPLFLDFW